MVEMTQKLRRHSGRVTPRFAIEGNYTELIREGLEPQEFWDDWQDYRDGMRNPRDRTHLRKIPLNSSLGRFFNVERWNKKLKKLAQRRKAIRVGRSFIFFDNFYNKQT